MLWHTTRFEIDLSEPKIMGIVNVTPDSFSDGGLHADTSAVLRHCEQLLKDGAHMLDIGGESSRPGAPPVPLTQELARVLPVLQETVKWNVPISVDSYKPQVMQAALDMGADIINDIWGFRQQSARNVVMRHERCGLVLMHMHREPATMQLQPMAQDEDVVQRVRTDLLSFCEQLAQIPGAAQPDLALKTRQLQQAFNGRLLLDPGIGFGKTPAQNFALLSRQHELLALGFPLLAGWSRKSSLGVATGIERADERMLPSVAAALLAVERGASVVRVHDVKETAQALAVWQHARPATFATAT